MSDDFWGVAEQSSSHVQTQTSENKTQNQSGNIIGGSRIETYARHSGTDVRIDSSDSNARNVEKKFRFVQENVNSNVEKND